MRQLHDPAGNAIESSTPLPADSISDVSVVKVEATRSAIRLASKSKDGRLLHI